MSTNWIKTPKFWIYKDHFEIEEDLINRLLKIYDIIFIRDVYDILY